jgi:hypothetical protein
MKTIFTIGDEIRGEVGAWRFEGRICSPEYQKVGLVITRSNTPETLWRFYNGVHVVREPGAMSMEEVKGFLVMSERRFNSKFGYFDELENQWVKF